MKDTPVQKLLGVCWWVNADTSVISAHTTWVHFSPAVTSLLSCCTNQPTRGKTKIQFSSNPDVINQIQETLLSPEGNYSGLLQQLSLQTGKEKPRVSQEDDSCAAWTLSLVKHNQRKKECDHWDSFCLHPPSSCVQTGPPPSDVLSIHLSCVSIIHSKKLKLIWR